MPWGVAARVLHNLLNYKYSKGVCLECFVHLEKYVPEKKKKNLKIQKTAPVSVSSRLCAANLEVRTKIRASVFYSAGVTEEKDLKS